MKVLLAEDNAAHRELIEILVRSGVEGSKVTAVETGHDFLCRLDGAEYDVALLDYHLPDCDASEILPRIDEISNHPPVIIISSDGTSDTIIAALRSGGRDFLPKTEAFTATGLLSRIREVLRRRQMEQRLIERQKDECIAALAGGIAHDFNNMLVGILGKASLLRESAAVKDRHQDYCDGIIRTAQRLADLSKQLLAYARGGKYESRPLRVNEAVNDTLAMLKGAVPPKINVRTFLSKDLWSVQADRAQLVQAFLNLSLNACEAMGQTGMLSVFSENVSRREPWIDELRVQHPAGDYVHVVIADTGPGIPAKVRKQMFEPFLSTKGSGRGLGLAAVKGIITTHGGGITVSSDEGLGTAFHLYLPRRDDAVPDAPPTDAVADASAPVSVLIVEDEPDVSEVMVEVLQRRSHAVTTAATGGEALQVLRSQGDRFDVVLIDMRLPDCSGADILKACREFAPRARLAVCSGYERVSLVEELLSDNEDVPFLAKPFSPQQLLDLVADLTRVGSR